MLLFKIGKGELLGEELFYWLIIYKKNEYRSLGDSKPERIIGISEKMKENCKWLTIFSSSIENDFIFNHFLPPLLYRWDIEFHFSSLASVSK